MVITERTFRLYAVTDRSWLGQKTLYEQAELALQGGATILQLREKTLDRDEFLKEVVHMKRLTEKYGVPLIINDDAEIARECGADGVHVGQEDASVSEVRKILGGDKIIGVSAHSVEEAIEAENSGADYLGVGAVFGSATKTDVCAMTYERLRAICGAVKIPVVAIGGITEDNIMSLAGSGISGAAVVSAVFAQRDIKSAARRLRAAADKICAG